MAHYAKVLDGIVTTVIVAEAEFFDTYVDDTPGEWIQTSYNTHENVHYGYDSNGDYVPDGGTAFRGNFAAVGGIYDVTKDAFYAPQPYASWTLNSTKLFAIFKIFASHSPLLLKIEKTSFSLSLITFKT